MLACHLRCIASAGSLASLLLAELSSIWLACRESAFNTSGVRMLSTSYMDLECQSSTTDHRALKQKGKIVDTWTVDGTFIVQVGENAIKFIWVSKYCHIYYSYMTVHKSHWTCRIYLLTWAYWCNTLLHLHAIARYSDDGSSFTSCQTEEPGYTCVKNTESMEFEEEDGLDIIAAVSFSLLGISVCLNASKSAVHSVHADGPPSCVLSVVVLCVPHLMDRLSHMSTWSNWTIRLF